MHARDPPIAEESVDDRMRLAEPLLTPPERQFVDIPDRRILWGVLNADRLGQLPVVLVLALAVAAVGILAVGVGDQLGEGVGGHQEEPLGEAVLEADLQGVEGAVPVVLSARVAVDAVVLWERTQRRLGLTVRRVAPGW